MSMFTAEIQRLEYEANQATQVKAKIEELVEKLRAESSTYCDMIEALQLIAAVSDNNTREILDYLTCVINKTLEELFPHDNRRIHLEHTIHGGQHAHIKIILSGSDGRERDLQLQSGTGLRQIISFLFTISLIEVRKGRRIFIADELLSGLHKEAKRIIMDIIKIFAEEGFQFVFVEYGVNDIGKMYLVEKPGKIASVHALGDGATYQNEVFKFNPPSDVDLSIFVDESSEATVPA